MKNKAIRKIYRVIPQEYLILFAVAIALFFSVRYILINYSVDSIDSLWILIYSILILSVLLFTYHLANELLFRFQHANLYHRNYFSTKRINLAIYTSYIILILFCILAVYWLIITIISVFS